MDVAKFLNDLKALSNDPQAKALLRQTLRETGIISTGRAAKDRMAETLFIEPSEGAGLNFILGDDGGRIPVPTAIVLRILKSADTVKMVIKQHADKLTLSGSTTVAAAGINLDKPGTWECGPTEMAPLYTAAEKAANKKQRDQKVAERKAAQRAQLIQELQAVQG